MAFDARSDGRRVPMHGANIEQRERDKQHRSEQAPT